MARTATQHLTDAQRAALDAIGEAIRIINATDVRVNHTVWACSWTPSPYEAVAQAMMRALRDLTGYKKAGDVRELFAEMIGEFSLAEAFDYIHFGRDVMHENRTAYDQRVKEDPHGFRWSE